MRPIAGPRVRMRTPPDASPREILVGEAADAGPKDAGLATVDAHADELVHGDVRVSPLHRLRVLDGNTVDAHAHQVVDGHPSVAELLQPADELDRHPVD